MRQKSAWYSLPRRTRYPDLCLRFMPIWIPSIATGSHFSVFVPENLKRQLLSYAHRQATEILRPTSFMASRKEVIDEAYAGDVVGLYDNGNFKIGDSLTEGESLHFKGIQIFSGDLPLCRQQRSFKLQRYEGTRNS
ncbi:MAG: hypothetical protein U0T81_12365 [Saprospiraceae bacterium]